MIAILGISAYFHDSAAALIADGYIVSAAQEERFTRIKHDASFPENAIKFCLKHSNLSLHQVDYIVFFEKPFLKFERLLETYVSFAPQGFQSFRKSMPLWLSEKLFQKNRIFKSLQCIDERFKDIEKLNFSEHHFSHAASAFYPSPFDEALVLTLDGVGEWQTSTIAVGKGNELTIMKDIHFPHSLGLLYSAFTYYLGFKVNSGEYKVMGLAPFGEPRFKELILNNLIDVKEDGSFNMDQSYFNYCTGLTMTSKKFDKLFGQKPRVSETEELMQFHMDVAASIQAVLECIVLKITNYMANEYRIPNLCLAGGVALNCVANGKILKQNHFDRIWVQPAAGDAGGAIGAALAFWYNALKQQRSTDPMDSMSGSLLGPSFSDGEIKSVLDGLGARYVQLEESEFIEAVAKALATGLSVGWFNGRMEFGPRSLGARSILADPRDKEMQRKLNLKVKFRESFRPFAPSVLKEHASEWFDLENTSRGDSPYMLLVADVLDNHKIMMTHEQQKLFGIEKLNVPRSSIPAVTHVDYSARVQTVHKETNPKYYALISKFYELTGCPVLVNTSFNVRGEPIVCTPEDAFNCFMGTDLDVLACGDVILYKQDQDKALIKDYKNRYELD